MRYFPLIALLLVTPVSAQDKTGGEAVLEAFRQTCVTYVDDPRAFDDVAQSRGWQPQRLSTPDRAVTMVQLSLSELTGKGVQLVPVTGVSDKVEDGRIGSCTFQVIGDGVSQPWQGVMPILDARIGDILGEDVTRGGGEVQEGQIIRYDAPGFPPIASVRVLSEPRVLILTYTRLFPDEK